MGNIPPSINQKLPKTRKSKASQAPHSSILNMPQPPPSAASIPDIPPPPPPQSSAIYGQVTSFASTTKKGKEMMVVAKQLPPPNLNKRKAIVLGESNHHPRAEEEDGRKNPKTVDGLDDAKEDILKENRGKAKEGNDVSRVYTCEFCNRRFSSSQAFGGHQNGHKVERKVKNEKEAMDKIPPSLRPMNKAYGYSLSQKTMNPTQNLLNRYNINNNTSINNPMVMGNGLYRHQNGDVLINGTFQQHRAATLPFVAAAVAVAAARARNNTVAPFYPINYMSYGTGHGGAIDYNNPYYRSGYYNGGPLNLNQVWVNNKVLRSTGYYGGVGADNNNNHYSQVNGVTYDPTQLGNVTGMNWRDFGPVVVKGGDHGGGGGGADEEQEKEEIDLTLKL